MPFDDKPSVQVFESVKQQLTEHSAVLHAFLVFTARYVVQLPRVCLDRIQKPADDRTHDRGYDGRHYIFRHQINTS